MAEDGLFGALPEQSGPKREVPPGAPRLLEPVRDTIELRAASLDSLLGPDHQARLIWSYVLQLDLSDLEARIKAREGVPGHPAITPRLLLALWLYATSEGVTSARLLERLCDSDAAYRWLCGGVGVNHRTLGEFRVDNGELLNRLLTQSVVALAAEGLIDLDMLAQDGVRVRASAGASSFRRRATIEQQIADLLPVVEALAKEVDGDPAANEQWLRKRRAQKAQERLSRLQAAAAKVTEIEAQQSKEKSEKAPKQPKKPPKNKKKKGAAEPQAAPQSETPPPQESQNQEEVCEPEAASQSELQSESPPQPALDGEPTQNHPSTSAQDSKKPKPPRVSTTDPDARVIKMPDGGFRPAYNMQIASVAGEQIVVAVDISTSSSDRGLTRPMLEKINAIYGKPPKRHLIDGGFAKNEDIEWAHGVDVDVYCPPITNKHNTDPYAPRESDGPGMKALRQRMNSEEGKATYGERPIHECINARGRAYGLTQLTVRGRDKALAELTLVALTNNVLQGDRLRRDAADRLRQKATAA
jgi:transposase